MPDPMIALRALRQIRGGGDSPIRRLAERAAGQRMDPGPIAITEREADDEGRADRLRSIRSDYEADRYADDMPDPVLTRMMFDERAAMDPAAGDAFIATAYKNVRGGNPEEFAKRPMAEDEFMDEFGPRALDSLPSEAARRDAALRSGRYDVQQYEGERKARGAAGALEGLESIFGQLDTGYVGREPLRGGSEPPPAYLAAGEAPRVGGMEDDEDEDLDRSVAALFRGR